MFNDAIKINCGRKGFPGRPGSKVSLRALESLWVRLKVGERIRPKDAQLLRYLKVPPFDRYGIYELNASGYVVAVGMPESSQPVDATSLLRQFEGRYGIPTSFSRLAPHGGVDADVR